jgi:NAD+ synthase
MFDAKKITQDLICYCAVQLEKSGGRRAVVGISGGKDSTVTAALMAKAIGPDQVFGVMMPDGVQKDIEDARAVCAELCIRSFMMPIGAILSLYYEVLAEHEMFAEPSAQAKLNLPPRVRMALLYAVAQTIGDARVINTSNLSEDWVGYSTLYGDMAGAFAPLGRLTTEEVIAIGRELGVSGYLLEKVPADGLTGRTDEDVLGFSYEVLNRYLREGVIADGSVKEKIDRLHRQSRFKFLPMPMFDPKLPLAADDIAGVYK